MGRARCATHATRSPRQARKSRKRSFTRKPSKRLYQSLAASAGFRLGQSAAILFASRRCVVVAAAAVWRCFGSGRACKPSAARRRPARLASLLESSASKLVSATPTGRRACQKGKGERWLACRPLSVCALFAGAVGSSPTLRAGWRLAGWLAGWLAGESATPTSCPDSRPTGAKAKRAQGKKSIDSKNPPRRPLKFQPFVLRPAHKGGARPSCAPMTNLSFVSRRTSGSWWRRQAFGWNGRGSGSAGRELPLVEGQGSLGRANSKNKNDDDEDDEMRRGRSEHNWLFTSVVVVAAACRWAHATRTLSSGAPSDNAHRRRAPINCRRRQGAPQCWQKSLRPLCAKPTIARPLARSCDVGLSTGLAFFFVYAKRKAFSFSFSFSFSIARKFLANNFCLANTHIARTKLCPLRRLLSRDKGRPKAQLGPVGRVRSRVTKAHKTCEVSSVSIPRLLLAPLP